MFEALGKAFLDAQVKDEEKYQRRKSRRMSMRWTPPPGNDEDEEEEGKKGDDNKNQEKVVAVEPSDINLSGSDLSEDDDDLIQDHDKWEHDYVVVIHMIAFAVGGSNVWSFGTLCFNHGGIAFMIPYTILTIFCAFPCVYLELLVGQYAQVGAIASWKLAPLFKGVGICMTLLSFVICFNIQAVLAWCIFYIFQSTFFKPLPWISRDNGFGKMRNGQKDITKEKWIPVEEGEDEVRNWHTENCTEFYADSETDATLGKNQRLPGSEFFRGRVQRMWKSGYSDGDDKNFTEDNGVTVFGLDNRETGILEYNLDTMMCLVVLFVIIVFFVSRGIKINSKTMLVLTIVPYMWLIMLFYRATGLSGALTGLTELWRPDFSKLLKIDTWRLCAEQVIFSTGAGYGIHLTCASHNKFNRRVVYDAVITVCVNALTSVISACTIFMFLGHVKESVNREISLFVRSGPKLVFEVMSDVLGVLAKANFYAFSFYLFIFLIALTTVTTALICTKNAYKETLPVSVKYRTGARMMIMIMFCSVNFVVTSLNLTRGGLHTYNFLNTFGGLCSLALTTLLFLIGITWFFGLREIVEATAAMNIRAPGMYFQICWKFVCPVFLSAVLFGLVLDTKSYEVRFDDKEIKLDVGHYILGFIIALGPCLSILGGAIHAFWRAPGKNCKEKQLTSISPRKEHKDILATGTGKRFKCSHYFYIYAPTPGAKCNLCCAIQRGNKVTPEVFITKTEYEGKQADDKNGEANEENLPVIQIQFEEPKSEIAP